MLPWVLLAAAVLLLWTMYGLGERARRYCRRDVTGEEADDW